MSYHIYTTKGIVLSERPVREADRIYTILTHGLGLVRATAIGVRKESSKLRGSIEPFSLSSVSLVRGREHWRLTSATLIKSLFSELKDKPEIFLSLVKNFSLLEKLVAGEERHPELFNDIEAIIDMVTNSKLEAKESDSIEIILAVRILFNLGYLSKKDIPYKSLEETPIRETLSIIAAHRKAIIRAINNGIQSSQL